MLLCCLQLCGGHYGTFQVVAWARMLVDYSQKDGLLEGAVKTFDGEHPCEMCKCIEKAKKSDSEKPENRSIVAAKLLPQWFIAPAGIFLETPRFQQTVVISTPWTERCAESFGASPPVPPPRIGLA